MPGMDWEKAKARERGRRGVPKKAESWKAERPLNRTDEEWAGLSRVLFAPEAPCRSDYQTVSLAELLSAPRAPREPVKETGPDTGG